jgi:16S rRNA (guanine966-N2)-methyltransferase
LKHHTKSTSTAKKSPRGQLRIIGGRWRGQKLGFADIDGLRPTGDRIRETLFNWLSPIIDDAHCLDLFAGSGALGFEALSRGAAKTVLIEKDTGAATLLEQSRQRLKTNDAEIINADAIQWLTKTTHQKPFDVVFLDPPFAANLLQSCCDLLEAQNLLASHATIYMETDAKQSVPVTPPSWQPLKEKIAGQVCYRLFRCD